MTGGTTRALFLNKFFECFLSTFTVSNHMKIFEYFNAASLLESMMASKNISHIHLQQADNFFNYTCSFVTNCFKIEKYCTDNFESKQILDSYEKVLISWTAIKRLDLNEVQQDLIFKKYSPAICNGFIESRLNNLEKNSMSRFIEEEIFINHDSIDEDDSEKCSDDDFEIYKEVLYSIGDFAKYSLDFCLPMLSK